MDEIIQLTEALLGLLGFAKESVYTLLFAASMSAGITFTTVLFRMLWKQVTATRRRL